MAGILFDVFHQNLRKKYIGSPYCVGIVNLLIQILIMVNEKSYLFVTYWLLHVLQQTISMLYFALWLSNRNYKCAFHLHWDNLSVWHALQSVKVVLCYRYKIPSILVLTHHFELRLSFAPFVFRDTFLKVFMRLWALIMIYF